MKNTIVSLFLVISFLVCPFADLLVNAKEENSTAHIVFESSPQKVNINSVEMGNAIQAQVVERDNKSAWLCDKSLGKTTGHINIDVTDDFLSNISDGTSIEIEVEYYDNGKGYFTLVYDGIFSEKSNAEIVYCGNSNEWKKHTFVIDDAYFGNRLEGFDFKICIYSSILDVVSPASVAFGSVNLKKIPQKNPIRVTYQTEEIGNIFNNSDEQKFNIRLENLLDTTFEGKIKYEAILRNSNSVEWEFEEDILLSEHQVVDKELLVDVTKYGMYFLQTTITNEKTNSISKKVFSLVNSYDGDPLNRHFLFNTHSSWKISYSDIAELIKKSGAGGLREGIARRNIEKPLGEFNLSEKNKEMLSVIAENNFRFDTFLGYGSTYINSEWKRLPEGEEELHYWKLYCDYITNKVKEYGITDVIFEVWNEPFFAFGKNATTENYLETARVASASVRKNHPDAKVSIGSQTGVQNSKNQNAFKAYIDAGIMQYADYFSIHPYSRARDCNESGTADLALDFFQKYAEEVSGKKVPVTSTEIGFCQTDYNDDTKTAERAVDTVLSYISLMVRGCCETFEYYDLIRDGHINTFREDCFGSLNSIAYLPYEESFSATDTYAAIANMNYLLTDADYKKEIDIGENSKCYQFYSKKFNKDVAVLWTYDDFKEVTLDLGAAEVEFYDIFGNKVTVNGYEGKFDVNFYDSPLYIVGSFSNFAVTDDVAIIKYDQDFTWNTISGDINILNVTKIIDGNAKVEVECPSTVTVIEAGNFNENNGKVVFKIHNDIGIKNQINVKVINDGKVVQYNTFDVYCSEAVISELDAYMIEDGDIGNWAGKIKVHNNSLTNCVSGRIIFQEPDIWTKLIVPLGNIPAGLSSEYVVKFPKMKHLGNYSCNYVVELNDGQNVSSTEILNFSVSPYADAKPAIDGVIDEKEWNKVSGMVSNDPSQIKQITDYAGIKDLSAVSYVMWDDDYLYFAADVVDNVFFQPEVNDRIWAGDSIQLGIVYQEDTGFVEIGQANTTFTEFGIGKTSEGVQMWRWSGQDESLTAGKITNVESAVVRKDDHTVYEFRIPWDEILPIGMSPKENNLLGFSMLVNDNDGSGRRGWIEYASGVGEAKDTSLFTQINLLGSATK